MTTTASGMDAATGTSNRIRVGFDNGSGELNIRDGAVVKTLNLTAGRRGGDALVNITGEGSLLHLTNECGIYANPQYAGSGALTMTSSPLRTKPSYRRTHELGTSVPIIGPVAAGQQSPRPSH